MAGGWGKQYVTRVLQIEGGANEGGGERGKLLTCRKHPGRIETHKVHGFFPGRTELANRRAESALDVQR